MVTLKVYRNAKTEEVVEEYSLQYFTDIVRFMFKYDNIRRAYFLKGHIILELKDWADLKFQLFSEQGKLLDKFIQL